MTIRNKILLVDDDPGLLRLLAIRLRTAGYDVAEASSGEKALACIATFHPQLIITDLRMEGMDGLALFEAVHSAHPALPVIILTAHGTIPDAVDATKSGLFGYLTKPYDSKTLMEHIERALRLSGGMQMAPDGDSEGWRAAIITRSPLMEEVLARAHMVAQGDASVFIRGDSGTGKELLAAAIHKTSLRATQPFIAVNCGAIPEALLESELFGHRKGAFTGASQNHIGLFQSADGGTLFLDEIGDMPLALQVKLLRVLQEKKVRPVGSTNSLPVDVRIISATHRDLDKAMADKHFREDLYYRLNVVSLELPSLVQRREDIPLLAGHFLDELNARYDKQIKGLAPPALELLIHAPWPGNVRQLYNVMEQVVTLSTTSLIPESLVQRALREKTGEIPSFADARRGFERDYLMQLLQITSGNVSQAARIAKRNRTEFYKLLHRHELDPGLFKASQ